MFQLDHISVLCMFNGESDLNTNVVFLIPWVRAFELARGQTDFPFFSFEYSDILIQGIFWSDYDMNQYMIFLLAYCCGTFESIACFFSSKHYPGLSFFCTKICQNLLQNTPFLLRAAYFYDLVRKQDLTGLQLL